MSNNIDSNNMPDSDDPCATLQEFACKTCGKIPSFFDVDGGVQQRPCPEHPITFPDGSPPRGPYMQETAFADEWLVW